ncbi:assimilatory sulfite reductase (NADPH) flavoprotein subunit [Evansella sp. AB-rgal1]|uniref:assimilatory sulfite reductase (NADPH) flavoprotein subunit n=1 Tax=Evansella sp. AB-rgal1 TaxID=3242696 RepID=UPI00359F041C
MVFQETNSPFNHQQAELLNNLLPSLTESQKQWLSGYLSAQAGASASVAVLEKPSTNVAAKPVSKEVTVLYGSQTGNAQKLAENARKKLQEKGFEATVLSMSDFKPNQLKKLSNLLIVVSTHGEGEPPDNALTFHEFLYSKRAPKLSDLQFSVLALGDTSYEFFCKTGVDFDQQLEKLGGTRIYPRVDCDLDFEEPAEKWLKGVLDGLGSVEATAEVSVSVSNGTVSVETKPAVEYSRKNPFPAEVLENINLNGRGSKKETRHIEISLEGSGLEYEAGDALGVFAKNEPGLVDLLIQEMKWNPEEPVVIGKDEGPLPLREALISKLEITMLTKPVLQKAVDLTDNENLKELVADRDALKEYMDGRDVIDFVREFGPWKASAQEFVSILRKLAPRLYSIASSLAANPEEVHLTIGAVRWNSFGRKRNGVCSVYCAERIEAGDKLEVFVQPNKHFKLPENPETPIIMVGPGTGVAPFRSFMQEREEIGASGKSWMFFGDQHFTTDFLYQTEWQKWLKEGVLTKMDVAFSRDTEKKVYVQHRMKEHSKEMYDWIQAGAVFYVCGDKNYMAKDVHSTLIDILATEGKMSAEDAEAYLKDMQKNKRYLRDVY